MEITSRLWQMLYRVGTEPTAAVPKVLKVLKVPFPFRHRVWQKVTRVKPASKVAATGRLLLLLIVVLVVDPLGKIFPKTVPKLCQFCAKN
jgi:hypothetical protein